MTKRGAFPRMATELLITMKEKYITRYEATKGQSYTFVGWRLCITRKGERFVRYFSDLHYGGSQQAHDAAILMRDEMMHRMEQGVENYHEFFNMYRRLGRVEL